MNRTVPLIAALSLAALSLALAAPLAHACGEGMFNMGQGLRYQSYLVAHPAQVLVYDDGSADHSALYEGMRRAGHSVTVVADPAALDRALHASRYDVVITDLDDTTTVQAHAGTAATSPQVLPVVARNRRHAPELHARYPLFLLDGASLGQYLKVINQLLSMRAS